MVDREITAVTRARDQFLRERKKQAHRIEIQRERKKKRLALSKQKHSLTNYALCYLLAERDA